MRDINTDSHEEVVIRAFIQKSRQERCLFLLSDPKRRADFLSELSHLKWFDKRFARPIPATEAHTVREISALLRSKGASSRVRVISQDASLDYKEVDLEEALGRVWGSGLGTLLSCIPGKLGYFENEDTVLLLER